MSEKSIITNQAIVTGDIAGEFEFSHEVYGEHFYKINILVKRLSNFNDAIPLIVSERLMDPKKECDGGKVTVKGQFRSYNIRTEEETHTSLSLFAREIFFLTDGKQKSKNIITLSGYVCKSPNYRKTPLGREIADLILAVNRPYGKADYLPCICWGRNARYAANFEIGEHLHVTGRIQSREYVKKISKEESQKRMAYEISVTKMELVS